MISCITKVLLALQLLVALGLLFALNARGVTFLPALMFSVVAVFLFRLLITANNFFWAWLYGSETPIEHRIGFLQCVKLFLEEFRATMLTSSWYMPFRSTLEHTASNSKSLPVLLVHGYICNSGPWQSLSSCLIKGRITHYAIDMEPILGDIDSYAPFIKHGIDRLIQKTGSDKVIIVAHSMGGLAVRAYMRSHGSMHIAKIITVGTPHHGTALANFGKGANSRQMCWQGDGNSGFSSEWLQKLANDENQLNYNLIVSLYTHHDNIVAPQTSSYLPGARNIAFHGIGHVSLLFDHAIHDVVAQEIQSTSA